MAENTNENLHKQSLEILAKMAVSHQRKNDRALQTNNNIMNTNQTVLSCSTKLMTSCQKTDNKENQETTKLKSFTTTPQKIFKSQEPITPTANLKMLVCAASVLTPASNAINITKQTIEKISTENLIKDIVVKEEKNNENIDVKGSKALQGRKEKSLGLLCKKFMAVYPEYSESGTTIMLDDVVNVLNIGRRRVYDIVNVLESMEMMVRQAKNQYLWFGKSRLRSTLTKLKALAIRVYGKKMSPVAVKANEVPSIDKTVTNYVKIAPKPSSLVNTVISLPMCNITQSSHQLSHPSQNLSGKPILIDDLTNTIMENIITHDQTRKEPNRSLGILCQKFIMLFMVTEEGIVSLDRAAKMLLTDPIDEGPAKYKTKVRRLYDIANILTSIDFLAKCHLSESGSKKAAYRWIGLDLKSLSCSDATNKAFQCQEPTLTRHSLLSLDQRRNGTSRKFCRSASANHIGKKPSSSKLPRTFSATTLSKDVKDGFDIEQWNELYTVGQQVEIEETAHVKNESIEINANESPKQMLFKQKLKRLQEEFPEKFTPNGILELISDKQPNDKHRRCLSSEFLYKDGPSPSKKSKLIEDVKMEIDDPKSSPPCTSIKQLISDVTALERNITASVKSPTATTQTGVTASKETLYCQKEFPYGVYNAATVTKPPEEVVLNRREEVVKVAVNKVHGVSNITKSYQVSNVATVDQYLAIPTSFKPLTTTGNKCLTPMMVTTLTSPVATVTKNGIFHVFPMNNTRSTASSLTVPLMLKLNPSQVLGSTKNMYPIFMHAPIKTILSKSAKENVLPNQLINNNTASYLTPPHVNATFSGKPPASPITFPKMTPETPSASTAVPVSVLNTVTRKLMSFKNGS